jgi:hypothetical protein
MMPDSVQAKHPLCMCGDFFENLDVFNGLVAYSTHIGTAMANSLKKVFEASHDVTLLEVAEVQRLIDLGAREARAMRERGDEQEPQTVSRVSDCADAECLQRA